MIRSIHLATGRRSSTMVQRQLITSSKVVMTDAVVTATGAKRGVCLWLQYSSLSYVSQHSPSPSYSFSVSLLYTQIENSNFKISKIHEFLRILKCKRIWQIKFSQQQSAVGLCEALQYSCPGIRALLYNPVRCEWGIVNWCFQSYSVYSANWKSTLFMTSLLFTPINVS